MGFPGFMVLFVYVVPFVVKIRHAGYQPRLPVDCESARTDLSHLLKKDKECENSL